MNDNYRPGSAKMLFAGSSDEERQDTQKKLIQGDIDYVFNVGLYVEGYDVPNLQRVVWAAPTASLVKYVQGCGRVFRTHNMLRGHLTGGREDSAMRRRLIAESPKPHGIVVTYYPQNCRHELCDPIDILGGEDLPPEIKKFARQVQDETSTQGGGSNTEEDLLTAQVFSELRAVLGQQAKELKAKADYIDHQFDPTSHRKHGAASRTTQATREAADSQWPNGEQASPAQQRWFLWKGVPIEQAEKLTKWRACVVRDLVEGGIALETAMGYGKRQALAVRDRLTKKEEAV